MSRPVSRVKAPNLIAFGHLVRLLTEGKLNNRKLAEATGLTYLTVGRYTRAMYHAKAIHIAGWDMDARGGFTIRIYKIGDDPDVPAPTRTRVQRQREQRKRERFQRPLAPSVPAEV